MFDQRFAHVVGLAALASVALAGLATPSSARGNEPNLTIDASDRDTLDGCDQVKIRFGTRGETWETARSDDRFSVPRAEASTFKVDLSRSGGMRVQTWDGSDYEVQVCKAAAGESTGEAQRHLEEVRVDRNGGLITAKGPDGAPWVVFLIVRAPRGASVDLATENGEIGVRGVDGTIAALSQNGPIHLKNCSGDVRVRAENGPVATSGGSGKQDLSTQNGPLAVALEGTSWKGSGLTGRTSNGPLALTLAPDYESGVSIDISGHSPLVCSGNPCMVVRRTSTEGRRTLAFGSSTPVIRLSTGNGPVAISGPDGDEDHRSVTLE